MLVFFVAVPVAVFCYAAASATLNRWNITAPMVFTALGALVFSLADDITVSDSQVRLIAEVTLVVILFHDASAVRFRALEQHPGIPLRLLLIGFPLAVVATMGLGLWLLPAVGVAGAWLIAGSITPTDAGLGAPTILNPSVPARVRRALNVESGLNDGLATPIVLLAVSALAVSEGEPEPAALAIGLVPVLLAVALALVIGLASAIALDVSAARGWSDPQGGSWAVLVLPLFVWGSAEWIGANGFIAAFVAGLVFGSRCGELTRNEAAADLLESGADLLGFIVWLLAGGLIVTVVADGIDWRWFLMGVLALTVLRLIPVAVSLLGSGLTWRSVLFIGWFGPRGLASIIFALIALETLGPTHPVMQALAGVTAVTVVASVVAHGLSAGPVARRFGSWCSVHDAEQAEHSVPDAMRGRHAIVDRLRGQVRPSAGSARLGGE